MTDDSMYHYEKLLTTKTAAIQLLTYLLETPELPKSCTPEMTPVIDSCRKLVFKWNEELEKYGRSCRVDIMG